MSDKKKMFDHATRIGILESNVMGFLGAAMCVIAVVLGMVLLSFCFPNESATKTKAAVETCVQNAAQAIEMSRQDKSALLCYRHAIEALVYAEIATRLTSDDNLKTMFATSGQELQDQARGALTESMGRLSKESPQLVPRSPIALAAGWAGKSAA